MTVFPNFSNTRSIPLFVPYAFRFSSPWTHSAVCVSGHRKLDPIKSITHSGFTHRWDVSNRTSTKVLNPTCTGRSAGMCSHLTRTGSQTKVGSSARGGYVIIWLCLSVRLSVNYIIQKVIDGFQQKFYIMSGMTKATRVIQEFYFSFEWFTIER